MKDLSLSIIITASWIIPHLIGFWEYDIVSIIFPLLYLMIQSYKIDVLQKDGE